jgi:O-antigen/teichoic acid export membrane protein
MTRSDVPPAPTETRSNIAGLVAFNASIQVAGLAVSSLAGLVAVGLIARYLGTADYGLFVTATAFTSLFQLVSDFGLEPVATRNTVRRPDGRRVELTTLLLAGTLTNVAASCLAVGIGLAVYHGNADLTAAIVILALQGFWGGGRLLAGAAANSHQKSYLLSIANMVSRLLTLAGTIVVVVADLGFFAVVIVQACTLPLRSILMLALVRREIPRPSRTSRPAVWSLIAASAPMGIVTTLNYVYFRLDLFLLSLMRGAADVAIYGIAYKVIEVFTTVPGFVLVTILPELAREDGITDRFRAVLRQSVTVMQVLAGGVVALACLSPQLITLIGGAGYSRGSTAMTLLLVGLSASFVQSAFGYALVALGQQARAMRVSAVVLTVNLVSNLVLIPPFGVTGAASALVLSEVLSMILTVVALDGREWRSLIPDARLTPAVVGLIGLFIAVRTVGESLGWPSGGILLVAGAVGGPAYIGLLLKAGLVPATLTARLRFMRRGRFIN